MRLFHVWSTFMDFACKNYHNTYSETHIKFERCYSTLQISFRLLIAFFASLKRSFQRHQLRSFNFFIRSSGPYCRGRALLHNSLNSFLKVKNKQQTKTALTTKSTKLQAEKTQLYFVFWKIRIWDCLFKTVILSSLTNSQLQLNWLLVIFPVNEATHPGMVQMDRFSYIVIQTT